MKNKIAFKLTLYFSTALLVFAVIIGSVFLALFKNQTLELQKEELSTRAVTMAETLSGLLGGTNTGMPGYGMMNGRQGNGLGAYLRFINDIANTNAWVVDENLQLVTGGRMAEAAYQYTDLPPDAATVVKEVFSGQTTFSEGFSTLLDTPTLTIGTPIIADGKVIGALLLHSPVQGLNAAVYRGFSILILSILLAMALALLLSVALALAFTKPLQKMQASALQMAGGNYQAKTGVQQNDEIGELAQAIDRLSEQLHLASQESEKLNQLRRDFVANISHELCTPVTVIRGSLEALCDEVVTDPAQVKSYHQQMLNESVFLQRLVNDLLDLSRLQNTDFKMDMQEISLCDVLNDAIRSAEHMARQKNIIIKQPQPMEPCTITGDYGRLRQMLLIVLDNAIKFSPPGGEVAVELKDMTIAIIDHGKGISAEDLPYIFDRFYKVKSEDNKNGTGLGLAIAKQIAERHHIRLSARSKSTEGTVFHFQFNSTEQ